MLATFSMDAWGANWLSQSRQAAKGLAGRGMATGHGLALWCRAERDSAGSRDSVSVSVAVSDSASVAVSDSASVAVSDSASVAVSDSASVAVADSASVAVETMA